MLNHMQILQPGQSLVSTEEGCPGTHPTMIPRCICQIDKVTKRRTHPYTGKCERTQAKVGFWRDLEVCIQQDLQGAWMDSPLEKSGGHEHRAGMRGHSLRTTHQAPGMRTEGKPDTKLARLTAIIAPSIQYISRLGKK